MRYFDAAVIGGGVLGCFAARNLTRWNLSTVLVERAQDVCTGITRANSAVVYPGYDNKAGSLKARLTVSGNAGFSRLCQELSVPFERKGSLLLSFGSKGERVLAKKWELGAANGVPGLQLLSAEQTREREPFLADSVTGSLYAPTTGTVNPWQLGIAAFENAQHNGCEAMLSSTVRTIQHCGGGYLLETDTQTIQCKVIINCAGLYSDQVQELLFPPSVRLNWNASDFLVMDALAPSPRHILFEERESGGRGIAAVATMEGNLMLEGVARSMEGKPWATTREGLEDLYSAAHNLLPELDLSRVIRSFAAVRPNPHQVVLRNGQWVPDGKSIGSFVIENPGPGFFSLIGIKTPGLTCAQELGMHLAEKAAQYLNARKNGDFDPYRPAITDRGGEIVCLCQKITRSEVEQAISHGAVTVEGVKRRTGAQMGICQGGRCQIRIEQILQENNIPSAPNGHFPLR